MLFRSGEQWAAVGHARDLPAVVADVKDFTRITLSQVDVNRLVGSFRNAWTPRPATGVPSLNGSASFGGNDPLLFGHRVGYLLSASLSSATEAREGQRRALADRGTAPGSTVEIDRFTGRSTSRNVLWGGLANLSTYVGSGHRIAVNALYNRSGDNDARVEEGEFTGDGVAARITRMQYVERSVYSTQVAGEHQAGDQDRAGDVGRVTTLRTDGGHTGDEGRAGAEVARHLVVADQQEADRAQTREHDGEVRVEAHHDREHERRAEHGDDVLCSQAYGPTPRKSLVRRDRLARRGIHDLPLEHRHAESS